MYPVEDNLGKAEGGISVSASTWKRVFREAYTLVGDRGEAEDLTQEAFVVLFQEQAAGHPVEHLVAWMRTVTRRLAYRRFHKIRPDLHESIDATDEEGNQTLLEPMDPAPSVEKRLIDNNLLRMGKKVLGQFSEKDRECVLMYFRGYDFLQIATILGVSRWTARRTTLRAIQKLQSRMNNGSRK